MIEVKDKLEGSHQMATFRYQNDVMMSENSANVMPTGNSVNISHKIQRALEAVSKWAA